MTSYRKLLYQSNKINVYTNFVTIGTIQIGLSIRPIEYIYNQCHQ